MPDHGAADEPKPTVDAAGEVIAGGWPNGDVVRLGTVDSTNRYVLDAVAAGRDGGFVTVCDHQRAGRGRRGRVWSDPPGGSLLCSVLFRPRLEPDHFGLLTLLVANATIEAIETVTGVHATAKWPNDVLIGERKVAGILAEVGRPASDGAIPVVVGVGVNISAPPGWLDGTIGDDGLPIRARATTLEEATGIAPSRDELLDALLAALARRCGREPTSAVVVPTVTEMRQRCSTIGRAVRIDEASGSREGFATGITDTGRLEVEIDGRTVTVDAADVTHLR
jgi:BirA family biotin operon repressor/biotin-[acetyl-CoA-carboxylase] ligase